MRKVQTSPASRPGTNSQCTRRYRCFQALIDLNTVLTLSRECSGGWAMISDHSASTTTAGHSIDASRSNSRSNLSRPWPIVPNRSASDLRSMATAPTNPSKE